MSVKETTTNCPHDFQQVRRDFGDFVDWITECVKCGQKLPNSWQREVLVLSKGKPKPMVFLCECGGYHTKAECPAAWDKFTQWFAEGLQKRGMKCWVGDCVRPALHRGDHSPFVVDTINADAAGGSL